MAHQWIRRREHLRRKSDGTFVQVSATWMLRQASASQTGIATGEFSNTCPICGADILSVPMPNGGWVHFEPSAEFARVKHPCFYIGEDIADAADGKTADLFTALASHGRNGN